jgi:hypothetical protein
VPRLLVPGVGRPTMGRGQTKEGLGGDPNTYPTDMSFGSKTNVELGTSSKVGPVRLGKFAP